MKILFFSPNQTHKYNPGNQQFRNEIAKHHDVVFVGPGWGDWDKRHTTLKRNALEYEELKQFDCLMTYGMKYTEAYYYNIEKTLLPRVHFQDDIFPNVAGFKGTIPQYTSHLKKMDYDIVFCRTTRAMRIVSKICRNVFLLPHGVDIDYFSPGNDKRDIDVAAPMSHVSIVYPNRDKVCKTIREMPIRSITKRVFDGKYVETLQRSKIVVNSVCRWRSFNFKFTEVPSCGALLLTDEAVDSRGWGFEHNDNMVVYSGVKQLPSLIKYYLQHDAERIEIASRGMAFVRGNHSLAVRVNKMTRLIQEGLE